MRRSKKALDPMSIAAARDLAVGHLARRDFPAEALRAKLVQQGFDDTAAAAATRELVEERLLDDARYGANYVRYHAARGQGPVRIADDLKRLGLSGEAVSAALADGPDWRTLACEVRERRFGPAAPVSWLEKARQARFLQYRGFSSDHIRLALGADFDPD
jgi:regulatory protein